MLRCWQDWAESAGVSRETEAALSAYVAALKKWNASINLVSRSSIDQIWERHILDSAQLFPLVPAGARTCLDIGSGAGFPGLVIAILARDRMPELAVTLIESDRRKAAFLRHVISQLGLSTRVIALRIEDVPAIGADILTARALAPLAGLLHLAERHLAPGGRAIFPKGSGWEAEVNDALADWRFSVQNHESITQRSAMILEIGDLERA